ncbi:response regulator receiver domain-containing protein [Pseudoduganella lurida]|uniref:Response regulator receiver domain-containing protein n=1 Tax=Pseudoduganella lurida TaxID=1036180 RepID=A0A562RKT7_9BURK|nr:response regulator [Pseudoduganella lurida]TWI69649.1 response regulator receiver domain-containing protein [Pseudoduganella lurida]
MTSASASQSVAALGAVDWSRTDVGSPAGWSPALRAAVDIMLNSPLPAVLLWGRQQVMLLNQPYATLTGSPTQPPGGRIPAMQPAAWSWNPRALEGAWGGEAQLFRGQVLQLWRSDGMSEQCFDLYYTPLRDGTDEVAGILCTLAPPAASSAPAAERSLRMLVVEDNLDAQYLVCEMLRAIGHEVDAASDGESALQQLEAGSFDLLFSDVSLPGMSGVELARQAVARWPGLQVIFASGYSGALTQQLEFHAEAIQKPYDIEQLQAILERIAARIGG